MHARVFLQLHIATCVFCYKRLLPNAKILFPRRTKTIKGENIVPALRDDDKMAKISFPRRATTIKGEKYCFRAARRR